MATATDTTTTQDTTAQNQDTTKTQQTTAQDVKRTDDLSLDKFPPELQQHIRELREENKQRRLKAEKLEAQVTDLSSKVNTHERAVQERNRQELADQNKFKELAESEKQRADRIESESTEKLRAKDVAIIRSALRNYANEAGIIDPEDVKSIDVRDLRVDDDGSVPGAKEAVEALKERKRHWFKPDDGGENKPDKKRASTTTPSGDGSNKTGDDAKNWDKKTLNDRWNNVRL